ncbi:MAG: hypothetical protein V1722_00295 [Candidatus Micrarchaeota archaeon]
MVMLSVEVYGVTEQVLNDLVLAGYAKTKTEAVRQAIIHLGQELNLLRSKKRTEDEEWQEFAAREALGDWDDARKLFKF